MAYPCHPSQFFEVGSTSGAPCEDPFGPNSDDNFFSQLDLDPIYVLPEASCYDPEEFSCVSREESAEQAFLHPVYDFSGHGEPMDFDENFSSDKYGLLSAVPTPLMQQREMNYCEQDFTPFAGQAPVPAFLQLPSAQVDLQGSGSFYHPWQLERPIGRTWSELNLQEIYQNGSYPAMMQSEVNLNLHNNTGSPMDSGDAEVSHMIPFAQQEQYMPIFNDVRCDPTLLASIQQNAGNWFPQESRGWFTPLQLSTQAPNSIPTLTREHNQVQSFYGSRTGIQLGMALNAEEEDHMEGYGFAASQPEDHREVYSGPGFAYHKVVYSGPTCSELVRQALPLHAGYFTEEGCSEEQSRGAASSDTGELQGIVQGRVPAADTGELQDIVQGRVPAANTGEFQDIVQDRIPAADTGELEAIVHDIVAAVTREPEDQRSAAAPADTPSQSEEALTHQQQKKMSSKLRQAKPNNVVTVTTTAPFHRPKISPSRRPPRKSAMTKLNEAILIFNMNPENGGIDLGDLPPPATPASSEKGAISSNNYDKKQALEEDDHSRDLSTDESERNIKSYQDLADKRTQTIMGNAYVATPVSSSCTSRLPFKDKFRSNPCSEVSSLAGRIPHEWRIKEMKNLFRRDPGQKKKFCGTSIDNTGKNAGTINPLIPPEFESYQRFQASGSVTCTSTTNSSLLKMADSSSTTDGGEISNLSTLVRGTGIFVPGKRPPREVSCISKELLHHLKKGKAIITGGDQDWNGKGGESLGSNITSSLACTTPRCGRITNYASKKFDFNEGESSQGSQGESLQTNLFEIEEELSCGNISSLKVTGETHFRGERPTEYKMFGEKASSAKGGVEQLNSNSYQTQIMNLLTDFIESGYGAGVDLKSPNVEDVNEQEQEMISRMVSGVVVVYPRCSRGQSRILTDKLLSERIQSGAISGVSGPDGISLPRARIRNGGPRRFGGSPSLKVYRARTRSFITLSNQ